MRSRCLPGVPPSQTWFSLAENINDVNTFFKGFRAAGTGFGLENAVLVAGLLSRYQDPRTAQNTSAKSFRAVVGLHGSFSLASGD